MAVRISAARPLGGAVGAAAVRADVGDFLRRRGGALVTNGRPEVRVRACVCVCVCVRVCVCV